MKNLIKKFFGRKPNVMDTSMVTRKMVRRLLNNTGKVRSSELALMLTRKELCCSPPKQK